MDKEVVLRIEELVKTFITTLLDSPTPASLSLVRYLSAGTVESTGHIYYEEKVTRRRLDASSGTALAKTMRVLTYVYLLVRTGRRVTQREMYYILIDSFRSQADLNHTVLDASAALGVPRCMMNVDAATRGVVAGCLKIFTRASPAVVNCEAVGTAGWPIPGELAEVLSAQMMSRAHYIIGKLGNCQQKL